MKALIVGLGSIGTRHLNNLYALGIRELNVFRSRNLTPPDTIPDNVSVFHDYDEALSGGPEIVVIANPTSYHLQFAQKALEAGCHLYIEKPVSHTLEDTENLMKTAKDKKRIVAVGCQLRFHSHLEHIRKWLEQGRVGKVLSVSVDMGEYLPEWHPWEDYRQSYTARADMGGGVVLTLIHEIDYVYWLFGRVSRVYATGGHLTSLDIDVEDTALVSLWTQQGVPIQLRMDYWRKPPVRTMNIVGEKGEIVWDYYKGEIIVSDRDSNKEHVEFPETWDRNDMFIAAMQNFLESIQNRSVPRTPLSEGIEVLKIALAAKTSICQQKAIEL